MPIQTLGIFDSVFNWVYEKLLQPVIEWLGGILQSVFNWIFEHILKDFLMEVFSFLWDTIGAPIANFFFNGIYNLFAMLLTLVDTVQKGFDVLIGLEKISYLDPATNEVQNATLLNYIISDGNIRGVVIAVTVVAVMLCLVFSIYSVMRSTLDFDFDNKRSVGKVLTMTAKSMLHFLLVPVIVWVGLNLASELLIFTASALSKGAGGTLSLSDSILTISSMDAGKGSDSEFAFGAEPWSKLADGTYDAFTFRFAVNISEIDYLVGFASCIFCIIIMLMCLFTFIRRIYDIVVLYIVSPYFASTMVLDDGQKFKQWRETFIGKILIGFGSAIGMRVFLMLVPIIMSDDIQLYDNMLMNATGGYVLKLIFILGGMYAVYKSSSLLTSIVSSSAGQEEAAHNTRFMHAMGRGLNKGMKMLGGFASGKLNADKQKGALPAASLQGGNKQPIPAAVFDGIDTGMKIDGKKGATEEQSKEWEKMFGELDIKDDYTQTRNAHIRDVEDMSGALQNLFGDDIVRGSDVEDMSDSFSDLFNEDKQLDLESFIKDDYTQLEKTSSGSLTGDLGSFIKEDYAVGTGGTESRGSLTNDLGSLIREDYAVGTGGAESRGSLTGDLGSFIREDYSVGTGSFGTLNVGGKQFSVPEGYVAMPKIVPTAKAEARVAQMKRMGGEQFGSYYDTISSGLKNGSYSVPTISSPATQMQSMSSVGGQQLHVPAGYTVVPEIMKKSDAMVAASNFTGGQNQPFYKAYSSAISDPRPDAVAAAPVKKFTTADIAQLEANLDT